MLGERRRGGREQVLLLRAVQGYRGALDGELSLSLTTNRATSVFKVQLPAGGGGGGCGDGSSTLAGVTFVEVFKRTLMDLAPQKEQSNPLAVA